MFVYAIVNDVTCKLYIGKTKSPDVNRYLQKKFSHAKKNQGHSHLFAAMRKYPQEVWSIHPLISGLQTNEELCSHEQLLIKALAVQNPEVGYNIAKGGEGGGMLGHKHSSETIKKISASNRGKKHKPFTPEQESRRLAAWQISVDERLASGPYHTPESIAKIKEARAKQEKTAPPWLHLKSKTVGHIKKQADSHRGMKHKPHIFSLESKARQDEGRHKRWHLNHGIMNPVCKFCVSM